MKILSFVKQHMEDYT